MPFATATILAAIGTAATVAGGIESYIGQKEAHDASEKEEAQRNLQMNLDATRQRRDVVRRAIASRAQALTNATNAGSEFGSGLQGGLGQIQNQQGQATESIGQNQQIGQAIFQVNAQQSEGQSTAATGSAIQGLGSNLVSNRDMYGRVGSYITGNNSWF